MQDKVRSRNVALREMIDRACTKEDGVSKSFASKPLKPLEQVRLDLLSQDCRNTAVQEALRCQVGQPR